MFSHIKEVNKTAVLEVAFGIAIGIIIIKLLTSIFARGGNWFGAEDAEDADDLENLFGRGRARRAAKRQTRRANRAVRARDNAKLGYEEGSAGAQRSVYEDEPMGEEAEQLEMAEMADFYQSLSKEDIDNMSDAEYAEYADFMDQLDAA